VAALVALCPTPSIAEDAAIIKGHIYVLYTGTPLAHVKVRLASYSDHWWAGTDTELTTETNAAGYFVFVGVSPGRHFVVPENIHGSYHSIWPVETLYMQPGDVAIANISMAPNTLIVHFYCIPVAHFENTIADRYVLRSTQEYAGVPRLVSNVPGVR
jgi:hypothetical protein